MYPTLRDFVDALDAAGELHRVKAPVSPILEIAEVADRVSKSKAPSSSDDARVTDPRHHGGGGKALLFENVEGSKFPVLINAYGSYRRMQMALGCTDGGFESLAQRLAKLVNPQPPAGWWQKIKKIPELVKMASYPPKVVDDGICQQVVKRRMDGPSSAAAAGKVNLFELPIVKCWPLDGDPRRVGFPVDPPEGGGQGRYITMAGIYTIHPDDAGAPADAPRPSRNVGMYRLQVIDECHTAMHWHMHHDGARHWRAWKQRGLPMPCAAVLGGQRRAALLCHGPIAAGGFRIAVSRFSQ